MSTDTLEQRVAALEREVCALKAKGPSRLFSKANPNPNWVAEVAGSMKDSPEFDEVRKIMREMREAELAELDRKNGKRAVKPVVYVLDTDKSLSLARQYTQ